MVLDDRDTEISINIVALSFSVIGSAAAGGAALILSTER
jgi:hypothetical protein